MKNREIYKYDTHMEFLLDIYKLSNNNIKLIDEIVKHIIAYNEYMVASKFILYEVENKLLESYQDQLDYNILSRLLYKYPSIIKRISKDYKYYKELKELYEFLTL